MLITVKGTSIQHNIRSKLTVNPDQSFTVCNEISLKVKFSTYFNLKLNDRIENVDL